MDLWHSVVVNEFELVWVYIRLRCIFFRYLSELGRGMTWGDTNEGEICPLSHLRRVNLEMAGDDNGFYLS
jgi:hypothetical protein